MKSAKKQREFIKLKAEGYSNAKISRILHISESTASRYSRLLEENIAAYKAEQLQELYEAYYMTKATRIKSLGDTLIRLNEAISAAELCNMPPERMLELKLKYHNSLRNEYTAPRSRGLEDDEIQEDSARAILRQLRRLLEDVKNNEIPINQAATEARILEQMLKGVETVLLEDRVEQLEKTIKG